MTTLATKLSVLAAVALAVSACTVTSSDDNKSDASTSTDGGKDGSTTTDGSTTDGGTDGGVCDILITAGPGKEDCDKCLNDSCCAEVNGCFGVADCKAFDKCLDDCHSKDAAPGPNDAGSEEDACIDACGAAHQNSVDAWLAYAECLTKKCQTGSNTSCK